MNLWLVGKWMDGGRWEFAGIFDTEEEAVSNCFAWEYFVGPCVLNGEVPQETTPWPGVYYPLAEAGK